MKKVLLISTCILCFSQLLSAQITNGQDTLLGNEWINFDQSYFKMMVAEDGVYRVPYQLMADAGIPVGTIAASQLQVFHNGQEIPIFISAQGALGNNGFIEFFGKKNTSELDRHLFKDPDAEMMNPLYSLFTDTAAYFLTWRPAAGNGTRYQEMPMDLTNPPQKEGFYQHESTLNYFTTFRKKQNSQGISSSDYGVAEGFSTNFANAQTFTLQPTAVAPSGGDGQLHIRYSCNNGSHQQAISLNNQALVTDGFFDYQVRQLDFEINNATLAGAMQLKFQGTASNNDNQRIANIVLRYPRQFDFENQRNFSFAISASDQPKYLEILNFDSNGGAPVLYDPAHHQRFVGAVENGIVKFVLPPSATDRHLFLVNSSTGIKTLAALHPVQFIDFKGTNAGFVIISNPRLYDDGQGNNWVQQYADYRSSADGGGFKTAIVDVQQLYDQFGWGLNRHPLSIRNFGHYIKKKWPDVKYVFIIGKGREYVNVRTASQLAPASNASYFVPTFGYPGSDNLLLAGDDGYTPVIPMGRIAASTAEDVRVYLNKVKEFEANRDLPQTIEDRAWMKRVLHLGGGASAGEQNSIKSHLSIMKTAIEQSDMSAEVTSFFKTSTDPIQIPQTQAIFDAINNGISIATFFGHSGVQGFDFSIDNPTNYENYEKYPLIISLGCYSGNIHTNSVGVSERFIFLENRGAIAFGATSGLGYISSLNTFASEFYELLGNEKYGESLSAILRKTIENKANPNDFGIALICQQFTFNGDPALKLNPSPGPDFVVDAATLKFNPQPVVASLDIFEVAFDLVNIGKRVQDSILLKISHEYPNGARQVVAQELIPSPGFRSTYKYKIALPGGEAIGQNKLFIDADASNLVPEEPQPFAEANNDLRSAGNEEGVRFFITDNSAVPVYPPEFAIVSDPAVVLKASTTDPLQGLQKYFVELDTTELFNSPLKVTHEIFQAGGVLKWQPGVAWQDSTVYYWRMSPDSLSPEIGWNWAGSSFIFIEGSPKGWSQSHFYQFSKDDFTNMQLPAHQNFEFITDFTDFNIKNAVNSIQGFKIFWNNALWAAYFGFPDGGINVMWLDSVFVVPRTNYPSGQGIHYGIPFTFGYDNFLFDTSTPEGRKELMDFLDNIVAPNEHIILATLQGNLASDYKPQDWAADSLLYGRNLFQVLEEQGAQQARQLETSGAVPYLFAYKKNVNVHAEEKADTLTDLLNVYLQIPGYWDRGKLESDLIGRAKKWNNLVWQTLPGSNPETDTVSVVVLGVPESGISNVEIMTISQPGSYDLSGISAVEFPYLKLRFNAEDSIFRSAPDLNYWRVFYEGTPEFAVNPSMAYSLHADTLQKGDELNMQVGVENISDFSGDSLLVKLTLRNKDNEEQTTQKRLGPLPAGDSLVVKFNLGTRQFLGGNHVLVLEANPENDQLEQTHVNNFLNAPFFVESDRRNPLLDVTFDGVHIMDGDIVSAKPAISVSLEDENRFLQLADTSFFKLFVTYPDSMETPVQIYFDNPAVQFFPAGGTGKNKAKIDFSPAFPTDGTYELVVQARDASGNAAGQIDYKVKFRIINRTMISNVLNYPNPFSTATRFVYTLTGSEPLKRYKLQIMTVSGRIVREITQQEMGELKVGTHQTEFAWDGRDEFGDRLANGVYLYRLLVEENAEGKEMEGFETGADGFFTKGIGKMVILR